MNILFIEDQPHIKQTVINHLHTLNYSIDSIEATEDIKHLLDKKRYDILLIDLDIQNTDAMKLLRELHESNTSTPIFVLASSQDIDNLVLAYKAGCCDYLHKPFDNIELHLRLQEIYKRVYSYDDESSIPLGLGVVYNKDKFSLFYEGKEISLSKIEKQILELLIKCKNEVVTVDMFRNAIWSDYIDATNVRVQINNLRKKTPVNIIENKRGFGYYLRQEF